MSRNSPRNISRINRMLLAGLAAAGVSIPALAQSVPFPTYETGPQPNGSWVLGDGAIIKPAGIQVNLGMRVRAKAIALNPTGNHTAAVLTLGASSAVQVFNTLTGAVVQTYKALGKDASGSHTGIAYSPDGKYLLFSQDSSHVTIAKVTPAGLLQDDTQVNVPVNLSYITCFPNSPPGTTGSSAIPCGQTVSSNTSYPLGIAISKDGKTAYAVLDTNNTLAKIDLTAATPTQGPQIRVGNVPHSVVISPDGTTAYVSNEAGRIATEMDFQQYSNGVPVVAHYPTGSTSTGTVSVVDLSTFKVTGSISSGLHPTGMAFWGRNLLVANAYSDSISVIDTTSNKEVREIHLGLPIGESDDSDEPGPVFGVGPNSIAVDAAHNIAYVALYNANAVAVVDLNEWGNPVMGLIPVAYAPSSVVLDAADKVLLVANDKGTGTTNTNLPANCTTAYGVCGFNSHQDLGTVSIVPVPNAGTLAGMTKQVIQNNHWDLSQNISSASGGDRHAKPVAVPEKIGDPSLIKHVFLIIRENRTYDQILGDVPAGNGDSSLAVFGANVTPNAHELVKRFPLLDNFYNPSRQSADGHNWITQAMAPYSDDIQSPDWVRDYPSNGGDGIAYQKKGHLWDATAKAGTSFKNYGEYIEYNTFLTPGGSTTEPSWNDFYQDTLAYESGAEKQLYYYNTVSSHSPLPNLIKHTIQNYPQFDLGIPDQFRVDIWEQDFYKDVKAGTVPQLSVMWISSDHTGGPPTAQAMQADNDLALGRFIDIISHSPVWSSSAIFVEEDDAQNGVDHVDGHRSPGYIISPYAVQNARTADHTYYTQVNMTRTIEQILGLTPMNQFDLVASPMRTAFVDDPKPENFQPWSHVPNLVPLNQGVPSEPHIAQNINSKVKALQAGWLKKKVQIFAGKYHIPDSEDLDTVNHLTWYEATGFTRPYPGEKKVRSARDFNKPAPAGDPDDN